MKFLCVRCDEPMRFRSVAGPDEGSVTVTFECPQREGALTVETGQGPDWTEVAEARLLRLPPIARPMARMAVSRYARERGLAMVTPKVIVYREKTRRAWRGGR